MFPVFKLQYKLVSLCENNLKNSVYSTYAKLTATDWLCVPTWDSGSQRRRSLCFSHHRELALLNSENSLRLLSWRLLQLAYRSQNIPAVSSSSSSQLTFSSKYDYEILEFSVKILTHCWMNMQFGFSYFLIWTSWKGCVPNRLCRTL